MSIEVKNLFKYYGNQAAVKDVSFNVGNGEIVGFLGPNGAGKSTTMKIITGYINASGGNVKVCGKDVTVDTLDTRRLIGYLPEHNPLYLDMYRGAPPMVFRATPPKRATCTQLKHWREALSTEKFAWKTLPFKAFI